MAVRARKGADCLSKQFFARLRGTMSEITAITPQVKDKERCNVYVDGRFYCGLKLETAVRYRLRAGQQVEPSFLDEIQLENEKAQALDKALTHLSASMKTERAMRDFLRKKGYVDAVCDYVLEKLREYRFVDDAAYCAQYAESASKNKGARLIALELRQKGAGDEAIAAALDGLEGEDEAARRVLEKYMRGKQPTREVLAKAYRHLLSKGFGHDVAKDALASLREDDEQ